MNSIVARPASLALTLDNPQKGIGKLKPTMRSAAPTKRGTKQKRSRSLVVRSKANVARGVSALIGAAILPLILAISIVILIVGIQGRINDLSKLLVYVLWIVNVLVRLLGFVMSDYVLPARLRARRDHQELARTECEFSVRHGWPMNAGPVAKSGYPGS